MRKYDVIWDQIKKGEKASITVSVEMLQTTVQAVKKLKTEENTARRSLGLVGWSPMKIVREKISSTHWKVTFEFRYSSDI